jgi:HEAT repeat protein
MMLTYFCPRCWNTVPEAAKWCPQCRYELTEWEQLPFTEKLLHALAHPIAENRLFAIEQLGKMKFEPAVPQLAILGERAENYYVQREALIALTRIGSPASRQAILRMTQHPSKLIQALALELLGKADKSS